MSKFAKVAESVDAPVSEAGDHWVVGVQVPFFAFVSQGGNDLVSDCSENCGAVIF